MINCFYHGKLLFCATSEKLQTTSRNNQFVFCLFCCVTKACFFFNCLCLSRKSIFCLLFFFMVLPQKTLVFVLFSKALFSIVSKKKAQKQQHSLRNTTICSQPPVFEGQTLENLRQTELENEEPLPNVATKYWKARRVSSFHKGLSL